MPDQPTDRCIMHGERLAVLEQQIQDGFLAINHRLDALNGRIPRIEERVSALEVNAAVTKSQAKVLISGLRDLLAIAALLATFWQVSSTDRSRMDQQQHLPAVATPAK
jgi:hypothetical protein